MGDGIKIEKELRSPVSTIIERLHNRIDKKLRSFFIEDIQNDRSCSIENYDADCTYNLFYLTKEGPTNKHQGHVCHLPMLDDISNEAIYKLLEAACQNAQSYDSFDSSYTKLLFNKNTHYLKWSNIKLDESLSNCRTYFDFPFVPEDSVYLLPDSDYFGVISVNINKFGAMCFASNIKKVKL